MDSNGNEIPGTPIDTSWINNQNKAVEETRQYLESSLKVPVEAFVLVIEEGKDVAVGFLKKLDAKNQYKIMRQMAEVSSEEALALCARAQLIRTHEDKVCSDPRFMDENGNYDLANSDLNFNLLLQTQGSVKFMKEAFKKK